MYPVKKLPKCLVEPEMESTVVILKPECIENCIVSSVLSEFEKLGMRAIGMYQGIGTQQKWCEHYADLYEKYGNEIATAVIQRMQRGPCVFLCYSGVNVIQQVRDMIGSTDPAMALEGTIRRKYATSISYNVIHASANKKDAERELKLWFEDGKPPCI